MSIVVTTPTGHIGAQLASRLLELKQQITVIARDPAKVAHLASRGARVVEGSHGDTQTLIDATRGAKALFLLTPPDLTTMDLRAAYRRFGRAAAEAVERNGIPRVVHLSSVGADLEGGNGPVIGLHDNERILDESKALVTHLRAGYFMENTLWQAAAIAQASSLFAPIPGDTRIPMIATRDIANAAAQVLTDTNWNGKRIVELQGAADITYSDVARVLSEVLGQKIAYTQVSYEQAKAGIVGNGASEHVAELFNELSQGLVEGRVRFHEPRSKTNTTPTSYAEFAQTVFLPMMRQGK